jgi:hypothetical protein
VHNMVVLVVMECRQNKRIINSIRTAVIFDSHTIFILFDCHFVRTSSCVVSLFDADENLSTHACASGPWHWYFLLEPTLTRAVYG